MCVVAVLSDAESQEVDDTVMQFVLPENTDRAKLFILVRYQKESQNKKNKSRRVNISIESCTPPRMTSLRCRQVGELQVTVKHTKWQKYMLPTSLIRETMKTDNRSLTLRISCSNCNPSAASGPQPVLLLRTRPTSRPGQVRRAARQRNDKSRSKHNQRDVDGGEGAEKVYNKRRPYLVVRLRTRRSPRSLRYMMRTAVDEQCADERTPALQVRDPCARHTMSMNFTEMGLNFILSPEVISSYSYCSGPCAHVDNAAATPRTPYARERSRVTQSTHCCRAVRTHPLEIIYVDTHGDIKQSSIPNFFADECACN